MKMTRTFSGGEQVSADRSETGSSGANDPVEADRNAVQRAHRHQPGPELFGDAVAQRCY